MFGRVLALLLLIGVGGVYSSSVECELCVLDGGTYVNMFTGESLCLQEGKRFFKEGKITKWVQKKEECREKVKEKLIEVARLKGDDSGGDTYVLNLFLGGIFVSGSAVSVILYKCKSKIAQCMQQLRGNVESNPESSDDFVSCRSSCTIAEDSV